MVEAEQGDYAEDDGAEEDFGYVVVEDLLVGVRSVTASSVFAEDSFGGGEWIYLGCCVLVHGHGLWLPKLATQKHLCLCSSIRGGVPLFPVARVFITKVPRLHNRFFYKTYNFDSESGPNDSG